MKKFAFIPGALVALAALAAAPVIARADVEDRLYDFTDTYYLQNGVNPAAISGRRQPGALAVTDTPLFPYQRNVRALLTLPAYDHSGNPWYFTVLGGLNAAAFTDDATGRAARQLAEKSVEYVFPQRAADPFSLGATRQSNLLDMRNGYFSNNPLGLWVHEWISYTDKALNTQDGRKALNDLARRNGLDRDGTPIIQTLSEIDNLFSKGYIAKRRLPLDNPSRYAICPVIKDPTDGGIARDQFLSITRKADTTPVEPFFLNDFVSLQQTGDWAD